MRSATININTLVIAYYQNALFLANLESLKDRRIKLCQSFFKKILSTDSCLHTLLPPERNNEIFSKLRNPLKYPMPHSRTKKNISPSLTMPLPTSRTVCDLYFIVHFIFHIANCLLCILYRVFLLYPRLTAHFLHVYLSYFTNPASYGARLIWSRFFWQFVEIWNVGASYALTFQISTNCQKFTYVIPPTRYQIMPRKASDLYKNITVNVS